jgi:dihydrofolate reductase
MNIIVAVDKNWGIGYKGSLLFKIKEDMQRFKSITENHVVVMGRKTYESMNYHPLPNRVNYVITSYQNVYRDENVIFIHDLSSIKDIIDMYQTENVFIIGGGYLYRELLDYCEYAYVTKVDKEYPSDTTFPNLDDYNNFDYKNWWEIVEDECFHANGFEDVETKFVTYKNHYVKSL